MVDRFWELLSKRIFSEANEAERSELEILLASDPALQSAADTVEELMAASPNPENTPAHEEAFELHLARMRALRPDLFETVVGGEPKLRNSRRRKRLLWVGSASLVGVVGLVWFFQGYKNPAVQGQVPPTATSQVMTKPGSRTQIQLPDGSRVWLNASSQLTYDKDFGQNLREVTLTGEAFFDVAKDASRPFIIHTKVIDVKVLGTEFNVRAYPNDAYTETSLIRGRVEVTVKNRPQEKHYLNPYEKVSVANNIVNPVASLKSVAPKALVVTEPLTYYHVDSTVIETSWVQNKLIFQENETFREVALKMERWYGVQINFADEQVAQIRPFGSFKTETIAQALDALKESFRFSYRVNGNKITITK